MVSVAVLPVSGVAAGRASTVDQRARFGPAALPARGHRPVLAVDNAGVRLARSHCPYRLHRTVTILTS